MNDTLRDYQQEMKLRLFKEWELHRSVMVQMPTGTGKTHLLAAIVREFLRGSGFVTATGWTSPSPFRPLCSSRAGTRFPLSDPPAPGGAPQSIPGCRNHAGIPSLWRPADASFPYRWASAPSHSDETPTPQRGGASSPAGNHEECRLGNT